MAKSVLFFYSLFFRFRICFDLYVLNFRNALLTSVSIQCIVAVSKDSVTTLSPGNSNYVTETKIIKKKKNPKCIFGMHH